MIYILLMSLPLLGQWLWGWRGGVVFTIAAFVYVIGVPYYTFQSMMAPLPGDAGGAGLEAKPEDVSPGVGLVFLSMVVPSALAVLAGAALAALWGMFQLAFGMGTSDTPDNAPPFPQMVEGTGSRVSRMLLLVALVVTLLAAVFAIIV